MDEELATLEQELRRLRPAAPTLALLERIAAELDRPAPRSVARWRWAWLTLPLAAAVPVGLAVHHAAAVFAGAERAKLKPVAMENLLVEENDEGVVTLDDGTPARRERRRYIDTITWRDPRSNASLVWTVPREEVLVVPISLQ